MEWNFVGLTGLSWLVGVWIKKWTQQVVAVIWLLMMVVKKANPDACW
ncbi:hypothetical protein [Lactiplantibacillus garii]|nr:hypothetical protein [Lactiplantibacillus garii]